MRFTLKYRGEELKSSGNTGGRILEKQLLRACFHRQLERVWAKHNQLSLVKRNTLQPPVMASGRYDVKRPIEGSTLYGFLFRHVVKDTGFVPLLTGPMEAHCHLGLRVGRTVKPGSIIFDGGDLDGRLKTLFDALRMPRDASELPKDFHGGAECLCLLSDDSLITGLAIDSYELFDEHSENYVDIDLTVTITAMTPMFGTLGLLFGG